MLASCVVVAAQLALLKRSTCHPERSEGYIVSPEILRFAQNDTERLVQVFNRASTTATPPISLALPSAAKPSPIAPLNAPKTCGRRQSFPGRNMWVLSCGSVAVWTIFGDIVLPSVVRFFRWMTATCFNTRKGRVVHGRPTGWLVVRSRRVAPHGLSCFATIIQPHGEPRFPRRGSAFLGNDLCHTQEESKAWASNRNECAAFC
jgi:hypothetical protein